MKKYYLLLASIFVVITSCKNEVENTVIDSVEIENSEKSAIDTVALIQKSKEDMVNLEKPYNEKEDAQSKINELVAQANAQGKNVFIQAGGNWCIWCLRFNDFVNKTPELKKIVDDNYLYYHLNYSKDNKNELVFEKYAPEGTKLGFPFFIILNKDGNVVDVVSSEVLENENDDNAYYDLNKTKNLFLKYVSNK